MLRKDLDSCRLSWWSGRAHYTISKDACWMTGAEGVGDIAESMETLRMENEQVEDCDGLTAEAVRCNLCGSGWFRDSQRLRCPDCDCEDAEPVQKKRRGRPADATTRATQAVAAAMAKLDTNYVRKQRKHRIYPNNRGQ